jgi:hypothetical protein
MKRLTLLTILLCAVLPLMLSTQQAVAQTDKATCDPAAILNKVASLKSTGDSSGDMDALVMLAKDIQKMHALCDGHVIAGRGNKVIPPVLLKAGSYRVSVETTRAFSLKAISSEGEECLIDHIWGTESGDTDVPFIKTGFSEKPPLSEAPLVAAKDCQVVFQVERSSAPWTLIIEPLR